MKSRLACARAGSPDPWWTLSPETAPTASASATKAARDRLAEVEPLSAGRAQSFYSPRSSQARHRHCQRVGQRGVAPVGRPDGPESLASVCRLRLFWPRPVFYRIGAPEWQGRALEAPGFKRGIPLMKSLRTLLINWTSFRAFGQCRYTFYNEVEATKISRLDRLAPIREVAPSERASRPNSGEGRGVLIHSLSSRFAATSPL